MTGPTSTPVPLRHSPTTLVDNEDLGLVLDAGPWHLGICDGKFYAQRSAEGGRTERLHTFLTGWPLVDHINGDGLDNRRRNLREATAAQNGANRPRSRRNRSGFKGVSWHKSSSLWRADVGFEGKQRHLGYFHSAEEAALAYDAAARQLYGEFARPNFPVAEEDSSEY